MVVSPVDSRASALVPRDGNPTRQRGAMFSSLTGFGLSIHSRFCRSTLLGLFFHDIVKFDNEVKIRLGRDWTAGSSAFAITKLIRNL
jgi:hypothetical protein